MGEYANRFRSQLVAKNPGEPEFHQAVHEVADSVELALQRNPRYVDAKIFERICEPERVVIDATSRGAGMLVLSDLNYPGWKADVDGQEVDIERVNYLMRGVPLAS